MYFLLFLYFYLVRHGKCGKEIPITCGSVIKLRNVDYDVRLHSQNLKFSVGSGQQSVSGIQTPDDVNSWWIIKGPSGRFCARGEPVKCGDTIRLEHLSTSKNLHSHSFNSPLSGQQEVSAFGEKGNGDTGDHWIPICYNTYWLRENFIYLRHEITSTYLAVSGQVYPEPIEGHLEVVTSSRYFTSAKWLAAEGIYISPSITDVKPNTWRHIEL